VLTLSAVSLTAAIVPRTGTKAVSDDGALPAALVVAPARAAVESLGAL
jgi:hypothetical protein